MDGGRGGGNGTAALSKRRRYGREGGEERRRGKGEKGAGLFEILGRWNFPLSMLLDLIHVFLLIVIQRTEFFFCEL